MLWELNLRKKIVIVGGGYAGVSLAHSLDEVAEVTLIEPREAFFHCVAAIRAVVQPELLDRLIIPYDRLMKNGRIIQARAEQISEGRVVLENGETIEGDCIIAATGSNYAPPFKAQSDLIDDFRSHQAAAHAAVEAAQTIIVVGAGPVGVELAAEIKFAHPGKSISILAASDEVVPGIASKLSKALQQQIADMGINLQLGTPVAGMARTDAPFAGSLRARGKTYEADLIVPAFGAKPVIPPVECAAASASGRLEVDQWMRPCGYQAVFALGDAADNGDPMTIVAVRRQVSWLLKTIKKLIDGKSVETLPAYTRATKPLLLVPLGRKKGTSILPISRSGCLAGTWLTQKIKGKDLFLTDTRKELGYT
ncbi:MAG: N-acyl homoserine lactone synthase [Ponticaulis sp.]|nr:N-acyl homoserine lactone synthase [Ponticaulis sp.]|tara:strand:- start:4130 stop:5227 length:1098 start_codon:yes stop_codon:yes gene_type:complete